MLSFVTGMVMGKQLYLKMPCMSPLTNETFSVQATTSIGATVSSTPDHAKLISANGTEFDIKQNGKLYYLNSVVSCSMSKQQGKSKSLREWHEILGHCNLQDVLALENVVDGMRVTGKKQTCVMGKMTQP